ncbi:MAG TPA: dienelactone hydrolase family protein [Gemmatimonadota bacterium]|nr:dienelactone hydrolase family protein [Gemmatimonadota bacterium]
MNDDSRPSANPRPPAADPHSGARVLHAGAPLHEAGAAVVLVHGRGGSAEGMLDLAPAIGGRDVAWLAPQATGGSWYPHSFLAPIESNEPWLSSALSLLDALLARAGQAGLPPERVALAGFSQGACLSAEFAAGRARRYGGLVLFSGGLIGPPGTPREYPGTLSGTPAFLGCSDVDPHIPVERVHETASVLGKLGAEVEERIYPGLGHTVIEDEIAAARAIVETLASGGRSARGGAR